MSTSPDASAITDTARLPSPYAYGGIDTINVLRAKLTPDAFQGFCIGMVHKRLHRGLLKTGEARIKDFEAAEFYMDLMMANLMDSTNNRNRSTDRVKQVQRVSGASGFLPYTGGDKEARNPIVEALFAPEDVQHQGTVAQQQRGVAQPQQQQIAPGPQTPGARGPATNPYDPGARR
jgi:hypothetical protein